MVKMPKSGPVFVALVLIATTVAGGLRSEAKPSVWLAAVGVTGDLSRSPSDLVVKVKKKKKKHDDATQGERSCPSGYMVLDKPNKYGAYCELVPKTPTFEWTSFYRELRGTNVGTDALIAPFKAECANYRNGYIGCENASPTKDGSVHLRCQCSYQIEKH
jgi:hypothetical protein